MWNHSQHNNVERTHFFRKIYLSHIIQKGCERVMCERWVGDLTNCNILTPSSFFFSNTSFSFYWAAKSGVLMAHSPLLGAGPLYSIWLQLTPTSCRTGLYHHLTSTCFLWPSNLHPIQSVHGQGYILMSSTGCTSSLIDGCVEGQYVTTGANEKYTTKRYKCAHSVHNSKVIITCLASGNIFDFKS